MEKIFKGFRSFINEGLAQSYRFDTATSVITDELLDALKRGLNMSASAYNIAEFSFINGKSESGRVLPGEVEDVVRKVDGRVIFTNKFDDPNMASVSGGYQESKKYLKIIVTVPSTFTMQDIRPSNLVAKIKSTLRHEFEHTLDSLRGLERKAYGLSFDYGSLEDYRNYFTSPHEINAYTVGFYKRHKLTGQSWVEIKNNFLEWLENVMVAKVNAEKSWDKIKRSSEDRTPATAEDVRRLIEEISSLLANRFEERYGKIKPDIIVRVS